MQWTWNIPSEAGHEKNRSVNRTHSLPLTVLDTSTHRLAMCPNVWSVWTRLCLCKGKDKAVPLHAWNGPEGSSKLWFPDYVTTAQNGGKDVSLTYRLPLPPGNTPRTHFCYRLSQPQGHGAIGRILCQWKIPMTPAGIEPATFRFVAQHLNHCATAVPSAFVRFLYYKYWWLLCVCMCLPCLHDIFSLSVCLHVSAFTPVHSPQSSRFKQQQNQKEKHQPKPIEPSIYTKTAHSN